MLNIPQFGHRVKENGAKNRRQNQRLNIGEMIIDYPAKNGYIVEF
jgi:hypothetical protein